MDTNLVHVPVLLEESLRLLNLTADGTYIDGTLGDGGHSNAIRERLGAKGTIISFDRDINAINFVKDFYSEELQAGNWRLVHANFNQIAQISKEQGIKPNGVVIDLGLSSRQLETEGRGFSYSALEDPLDMRSDNRLTVTAADLLKVLNEGELIKLLRKYGEETAAAKIAKAIKKSTEPIETVSDLVNVINREIPASFVDARKKAMRRVFQALRIAVNDELNNLKDVIEQAIEILEPEGRLVIITFHSLEDRIVKQVFSQKSKMNLIKNITEKPIEPSQQEIDSNPRARSAKLRAIEKI